VATVTVGAREANQQFSALLAAAERNGDTVVITRRGRPVARLIPEPTGDRPGDPSTTIRAWVARYARGSGNRPWKREELYERHAPDGPASP